MIVILYKCRNLGVNVKFRMLFWTHAFEVFDKISKPCYISYFVALMIKLIFDEWRKVLHIKLSYFVMQYRKWWLIESKHKREEGELCYLEI